MAEFLTLEEGRSHFGSKGKANAGLTLGIIGTALGALNSGMFGGNGILGNWGWNRGNNNGASAFTGAMIGSELANHNRGGYGYGYGGYGLDLKEINDQEFDLWEMGKIREEGLKNAMWLRERDVQEKADIYHQSVAENNRIYDKIGELKDLSIKGLADVYQASVKENRVLERQISGNQLESFKNVSDLYTSMVKSDKDLELQIERNREKDQEEKFGLYKDLSEKNTALAYSTMRQSYEDRIEAMEKIGALANRVCALEKDQAVTAAQLPLMFRLSDSHTRNEIGAATCHKINGQLTINPTQISSPFSPFGGPFGGPYCGNDGNNCGCGCGYNNFGY